MSVKYDLDRMKLLNEAPELIRKAVQRGWMSYPIGQKFMPDGRPDPMLFDVERIIPQKYTPELCRRAYLLLESGMTLDDTAAECGVARVSIVYLITKGHDQQLAEDRSKLKD